MIDKIIESKLGILDEVVDIVAGRDEPGAGTAGEDQTMGDFYRFINKIDKQTATTSIHRQMDRLFRSPSIGLALSPSKLVKLRTEAYDDLIYDKERELIESDTLKNKKLTKKKLTKLAKLKVDEEINTKIENRESELIEEAKKNGEVLHHEDARSKVLKEMDDLVGFKYVPDMKHFAFNSQSAGENEVFVSGGRLASDLSVAASPTTLNTYHDVNISNLVRFGNPFSNAPLPKRISAKINLIQNMIDTENSKLDEVNKLPDTQGKDKYIKRKIEVLQSDLDKINVDGVWTPKDLNIFCYGDSPPPPQKEADIAEYRANKNDKIGLLPNLRYEIWKDPGFENGRGAINNIIRKIDKRINGMIENGETKSSGRELQNLEKDRSKWEKYGRDWYDNNGDITKVPNELFTIITKHIVDRITAPYMVDGKQVENSIEYYQTEAAGIARDNGDNDSIRSINDEMRMLDKIRGDDDTVTIQIGYELHVRNKAGNMNWREPKNLRDARNDNINSTNIAAGADMFNEYHMASLVKRINTAKRFALMMDSALDAWVSNKILTEVMRIENPAHVSRLNMGSDPGVIDKFIGDIDTMERIYGVDTRISWMLIPFINKHKDRANKFFNDTREIAVGEESSLLKGINPRETDGGTDFFSDFKYSQTGALFNKYDRQEVIDPATKQKINIADNNFDEYINLAMTLLKRKYDLEDNYEDNLLADQLIKDIGEIEDKIIVLQDKLKDASQDASRDDNSIIKIESSIKEYMIEMDHKKEEVKSLSETSNEMWVEIVSYANDLASKGIKNPDQLAKASKSFTFAFDEWLESTGKVDELNDINDKIKEIEAKGRGAIDNSELQKLHELYDINMESHKKEYKQATGSRVADVADISELSKDEEIGTDILDATAEVIEVHGEILSNEKIAELVSDKLGKHVDKSKIIRPDEARKPSMLSSMVNSISEYKKDSGQEINVVDKMNDRDGNEISMFIEAMKESILAKIELGLLSSSQTRIMSGQGINMGSEAIYQDTHGVEQIMYGYDLGEPYGKRTNPINLMRIKSEENEVLAKEIGRLSIDRDKAETSGDHDTVKNIQSEIGDKESQIERNVSLIDEYDKFLSDNKSIREMSKRSESISSKDNPYLREDFDQLLDKMGRFASGAVDVSWDDKDESSISFLHSNTPTLQSMGIVGAMVSNRYLYQMNRSIDHFESERTGLAQNKDITKLASVTKSNMLTQLENMNKAYKNHNELMDFINNKEFEGVTIANVLANNLKGPGGDDEGNIVRDMMNRFLKFANGSIMRGSLSTASDNEMAVEIFKRDILFDNFIDYEDVAPVIDIIINKASEMETLTEEDIGTLDSLYADTKTYIDNILKGAHSLYDGNESSPYSPADLKSVVGFIESIQAGDLDVDSDDFRDRMSEFMEFMDDLEINKEREEIYADVDDELAAIKDLNELEYLIKTRELYKKYHDKGDESIRDELIKISDETEQKMKELSERGFDFDVDPDNHELLMGRILSHKNSAVRKFDVIENMYKERYPDTMAYFIKSGETIHNYTEYNELRYKLETTIDNDEKMEIKEKISEYKSKIEISQEGGGISNEYRNRLKVYDNLIKIRNDIIGSGSKAQLKEAFNEIIARLILMTKEYNKKPSAISGEILDRFERYREIRSADELISRKSKRTAKYTGVIRRYVDEVDHEISKLGELDEDHPQDINMTIYPALGDAQKIDNIVGVEYIATLYNPRSLLKTNETQIDVLGLKPFTIRLDKELDPEDDRAFIEYVNTSESIKAIIRLQ